MYAEPPNFPSSQTDPSTGIGLYSMQGAIHNILCSRLLFHVRRAVNDPSFDTHAGEMTLSVPAFANISNERWDPADTGTDL